MSDELRIEAVEVIALHADFADVYGGADAVPKWVSRPSAHFQRRPRLGQRSVLVRVRAGGLVGWGEAWALPHHGPVTAALVDVIAPQLLGIDVPVDGADGGRGVVVAEVADGLRSLGHDGGVYADALSAVDVALWDLRGQALGEPVHRLLGTTAADSVRVYAGSVPFRDSISESVEHARRFLDEGHGSIKVKVGRVAVESDLEHVGAIVAAHPDVEVVVDANGAWDAEQAATFERAARPLGLGWIEDPLPGGDLGMLAPLRTGFTTPVAAGENEDSLRWFAAAVRDGAVDVVTPNVSRAGGITGIVAIAALAEERGATVALHGVGGAVVVAASLHLAAALPAVTTFEHNRLANPLRDELSDLTLTVSDGTMRPPSGAGLGITIDEDVLERHTVATHTIEPARTT